MERFERIEKIKKRINLLDTQMVMQYGSGVRQEIADLAENILKRLQKQTSKEQAGELLNRLIHLVRKTEEKFPEDKDGRLKGVFWETGKVRKFRMEFEKNENQIDDLMGKLEVIRMELLKNIGVYDVLLRENQENIENLRCYIQAGEEMAASIRQELSLFQENSSKEKLGYLQIQAEKKREQSVNQLEKKIIHLRTNESIALQMEAQIKLMQRQDKFLADKIQKVVQETIPLWKNRASMAIEMSWRETAQRKGKHFFEGREMLKEARQTLTSSVGEAISVQKKDIEIVEQTLSVMGAGRCLLMESERKK